MGGNTTFLLNVPPAPNGLVRPANSARLRELGGLLRRAFAVNLADSAQLSASGCHLGRGIENVRVDSYAAWFRAPDAVCEITVRFPREQEVSYVVLKNIMDSQRIERFSLRDETGKLLYSGTAVGYKKIVPLAGKPRLRILRICIEDSRVYPTLLFLGVIWACSHKRSYAPLWENFCHLLRWKFLKYARYVRVASNSASFRLESDKNSLYNPHTQLM